MKTLCLFFVICIFYSCRTECTCDKYLGCMIVKVKKKYTDSIIADTIICSTNHYSSDTNIKLKANEFFNRYNLPPYEVVFERKDSIYKRLSETGMSNWAETEKYRNQGYECSCAK